MTEGTTMTAEREAIVRIAKGLTSQEREVTIALCGNSWEGEGNVTPGLALMNGREFISLYVLKTNNGMITRYKAYPTALGQSVRDHLKESTHE